MLYRAETCNGKAFLVTPDGLAYRAKSKAAAQADADKRNRTLATIAAEMKADSEARNLAIFLRALRVRHATLMRKFESPTLPFIFS